MDLNYIKAKEKMLTASGDDCQYFFAKNNCFLELAYWELLHSHPQKAFELFGQLSEYDIRAAWGMFLSGLVQGKINHYPSYFQLRNFLEIDLNMLLQYYLGNYVENVTKYSDWLYTINPEIYKFIGRVFLKNNYEEYGLYFLNKAKSYFFHDPELHYLLAEFFVYKGDIIQADSALQNCLNILPEYYPAIALKRILKTN